MKKLVLLLAVVFSVSLFSCGNADKNAATDSAADTTAVVDSDSAATDSAAAPADSAAAPADSAAAQK